MKIRNGFVSNSSSSSFVIAIDVTKNKPCECCGRKDPDIVTAINSNSHNGFGDNNDVLGWNYKETVKIISEEWCDSVRGDVLKKIKAYDNDKWNVVYFQLSYHSSTLHDILDNMVASKSAVILFNES